ncbi:hypothetical protein SG34_032875 [Thalassomonas viridans]|uniref:Type III secretion protein n=1 Tax=Thalassomonas viridans TaxID=137584 RepID=A0AAE9Z8Y3_9GAMM|nr:EscI/YscI/HrpB family type III secretion system inner rod protein [Thalassomonas viridans]WDE08703.1 hypothetical protein SG34_032875 [Thalassomonas viridans]
METTAISSNQVSVDEQLTRTYQPFIKSQELASLPPVADPQAMLLFEQKLTIHEVQDTQLSKSGSEESGVCAAGEVRADGSCHTNDGRGSALSSGNGILGDKVLQKLDAIRQESLDSFESIQAVLNKDKLDSADLLKTQFEIQLWSLHQDVYSKITGTFDRNVDTLLKAQ